MEKNLGLGTGYEIFDSIIYGIFIAHVLKSFSFRLWISIFIQLNVEGWCIWKCDHKKKLFYNGSLMWPDALKHMGHCLMNEIMEIM